MLNQVLGLITGRCSVNTPMEVGMFVLFPRLTWQGELPSTPALEVRQNHFPSSRKASIQTNRRSLKPIDDDRPSTCFGDNGGGLIDPTNLSNDKKGSRIKAKAIVIGISIFHHETCLTSRPLLDLPIPSVFTRVSNYNDWIKNKMEGGPSCKIAKNGSLELKLSFFLVCITLVSQIAS